MIKIIIQTIIPGAWGATFASHCECYLDYCSNSVFCLGRKGLDSEATKLESLRQDPGISYSGSTFRFINYGNEPPWSRKLPVSRVFSRSLWWDLNCNRPMLQSLPGTCCPLLIWLASFTSGWTCTLWKEGINFILFCFAVIMWQTMVALPILLF